MNKKLLTLAVAAALTAPTAAMAEAILYGKLHVSIDYFDIDGVYTTGRGLGVSTNTRSVNGGVPAVYATHHGQTRDYQGWSVSGGGTPLMGASRASRIGVKGSEDLGSGLKAVYQVEFGVSLSNSTGGRTADGNRAASGDETLTMRNSYVGLAGGFGTFLVGRHDTPMKISTGPLDLFADTMADYNGTVGFDDVRADNVIAYISPNWGGFQLAAAVHAGGGDTVNRDGFNYHANSIAAAYSVAGIYKNGPFYASLAYESLGNELFMSGGFFGDESDTRCLANAQSCAYIKDNFDKWRVGLGLLDWNGFTLTGIYEEQSGIPTGQPFNTWQYFDAAGTTAITAPFLVSASNEKLKIWQVQAGYAFGNNMIKAMYGSGNRDGRIGNGSLNNLGRTRDAIEGDYYTWAVAFDHNFSKRTKAYVLYTQVVDDDDFLDANGAPTGHGSWDGFSMGMVHSF
jgi:predicted porin